LRCGRPGRRQHGEREWGEHEADAERGRGGQRLVVVDQRGRIAGIVSRSNLLQVFLRTDHELRDEVVGTLIPALIPSSPERIKVEVRSNIVTLSGEVDRKSEAEILTRWTRELDGVVDVVDHLTYSWDDTAPVAIFDSSFRPV